MEAAHAAALLAEEARDEMTTAGGRFPAEGETIPSKCNGGILGFEFDPSRR